uniref:Uncharacterized protein n=1 Tax=Clandestinovirus TaxID=2831644 RepID=A0A8F8KTR8_9VIRU|nr:hypothetical protein KOM_12_617 [Clandestinovirus]
MYTKPQPNYYFSLKRKADSVFEQLQGRPVKVAKLELYQDVSSIKIKKTAKGFQVEIEEVSHEEASYASDNASSSSSEASLNAEQFLDYAHRNSDASTSCGPISNGIPTCKGCNTLTCEDCRPFNLRLDVPHSLALSPQYNQAEEVDSAHSSEESDDAATHVLHTPKAVPYSTHCRRCSVYHCEKCLNRDNCTNSYSCCGCLDANNFVDLQRLFQDGHIFHGTKIKSACGRLKGKVNCGKTRVSFQNIKTNNGVTYDCLCQWFQTLEVGPYSADPMCMFAFENAYENTWYNFKTFVERNYH